MLQLLFNFKIGRAQWPHLKVIRSARWPYVPWQLGHPPWQPQWLRRQLPRTGRPEIHVTNHWHSPGQTKQVDVSGSPQLYVAFLDLFFFFFFSSPASNCSEFSPWPNFICEKMPSERACWDVVWACTPEEGQQSVCTQRMEKNVSVLQRLLNTLFPKWISSFQQG